MAVFNHILLIGVLALVVLVPSAQCMEERPSKGGKGPLGPEREKALASLGKRFHHSKCGTNDKCCAAAWSIANRRDTSVFLRIYNTYGSQTIYGVTLQNFFKDEEFPWPPHQPTLSNGNTEFRVATDCKFNARMLYHMFTGKQIYTVPDVAYPFTALPPHTSSSSSSSSSSSPSSRPTIQTLYSDVLDANENTVFLMGEHATRPYHYFLVQRVKGKHEPSFRVYSAFARAFRLVDWMTGFSTMRNQDNSAAQAPVMAGAQLLSKAQMQQWFEGLVSMYKTFFETKSLAAKVTPATGHKEQQYKEQLSPRRGSGDKSAAAPTVAQAFESYWTAPADACLHKPGEILPYMEALQVWSSAYTPEACEENLRKQLAKAPQGEWDYLKRPALPVVIDPSVEFVDS